MGHIGKIKGAILFMIPITSLNLSFGYESGFDEERWKFDLCESCLVDFVKTFKYSPTIIKI